MKRFRSSAVLRGEGRFIKQSGPIGRFGHVILQVECLEASQAISIAWDVSEDVIPTFFRDSVVRGILRLFEPGAKYAGYSSDGLAVRVVGGTFHPTDSNELSFELAAAAAFNDAIEGG